MPSKSSEPNLLYMVIDGWSVDEVRSCFGKQHITIDACHERPAWSLAYRGNVFEAQTLYGEYGGFVGSGASSSLSAKRQQERDDNIRKMLEILAELVRRGRVVLFLSMPGFEMHKQPAVTGALQAEFLLTLPPNVPVMFDA